MKYVFDPSLENFPLVSSKSVPSDNVIEVASFVIADARVVDAPDLTLSIVTLLDVEYIW